MKSLTLQLVLCVLNFIGYSSSNDCELQYKGSCVNFRYSSCLAGQYYTLNGCNVEEMCCFSKQLINSVPAIQPDQCGLSTPQVEHTNKIVGGSVASPGEFPWQVSLQNLGQHVCGGILIGKNWILTAAHCFRQNHIPQTWNVVVGENDRAFIEGYEKIVQVEYIFVHSGFDTQNYVNDIAMMKLVHDVDINAYVRPVCLPSPTDSFEEHTCIITGWGAAYSGGRGTHALYKANVPVLQQSVCSYLLDRTIPDTMLCAGLKQGGIDTCQGDSGGPMVCQVGDTYRVAGIVSWGYSCAEKYTPGAYTNVVRYMDWIQSVLSAYDTARNLIGKREHSIEFP